MVESSFLTAKYAKLIIPWDADFLTTTEASNSLSAKIAEGKSTRKDTEAWVDACGA